MKKKIIIGAFALGLGLFAFTSTVMAQKTPSSIDSGPGLTIGNFCNPNGSGGSRECTYSANSSVECSTYYNCY